MEFTEEVSVFEQKYVNKIISFLKEYGCDGEYIRELNSDKPHVIYHFKNPGWSISRSLKINEKLHSYLSEYCSIHDCLDIMDEIIIIYD